MANYVSTSRTNYFRVTDLDAFTADLARHGINVGDWGSMTSIVLDADPANDPKGSIALFDRDGEGWPMLDDEDCIIARLDDGVACNEFIPQGEARHRSYPGTIYLDPDTGEFTGTAKAEDMPEPVIVATDECETCGEPKSAHTDTRQYENDLTDLVAAHLIDGDVAIFTEVGSEKMRYLGGRSVAINNKGETAIVDLEDIYSKAESLGETITAAVY